MALVFGSSQYRRQDQVLFDPYKVLEIINPDTLSITCVGYAPKSETPMSMPYRAAYNLHCQTRAC